MGQIQNSPICIGYQVNHDEEGTHTPFNLSKIEVYKSVITSDENNRYRSKDAHLVSEDIQDNCHIISMFDGFDPDLTGNNLSSLGNESLRSYLDSNKTKLSHFKTEDEIDGFLKDAMGAVEKDLCALMEENKTPGSSCLIAFIKGNKIHVANLGTSRAVLCRSTPAHTQVIHLSRDNKLSQPDEARRIMNLGGKYSECDNDMTINGDLRIWLDNKGPSTSATRALVSSAYKRIGVISNPEIEHFDLVHLDKFAIIASDGLWNVMESDEAIDFVLACTDKKQSSDLLAKEAKKRWSDKGKRCCEDISVIIIYFNFAINEKSIKKSGGYIEMRRNF